jgi:hypothetical protein
MNASMRDRQVRRRRVPPWARWPRSEEAAVTSPAAGSPRGVTLFGVLNVKGQTGYNNNVTLPYELATSHQLCGSNANPAQAQLVAAK